MWTRTHTSIPMEIIRWKALARVSGKTYSDGFKYLWVEGEITKKNLSNLGS